MLQKNNGTSQCLDRGMFRVPVTPCSTKCGYPTGHVSGKCDVALADVYEWCDKKNILQMKGQRVNNAVCMVV